MVCDEDQMTCTQSLTNTSEDSTADCEQLVDDDRIDMDYALKQFDCIYHDIQKIVRMHEHFMKLELAGKLPVHPLNQLTVATKAHVAHVWDLLISSIPYANQSIFGICQYLPQFNNIEKEDQSILLREGYFAIWLLSHCKLFHGGETYMRFRCKARYSHWWMNHIIPVSLIDRMHKFANELNSYMLTDQELVTLCALQLINPERQGLSDVTRIQQIHDRYLDILAYLIHASHNSSHGRVLMRILKLLPQLEPINQEQKIVIGNFSVDTPAPEGQLQYSETSPESEENLDYKIDLDFSMYENI